MARRRKKNPINILLTILVIALIAVLGVIAFKLFEYNSSESYYDGLRSRVEVTVA